VTTPRVIIIIIIIIFMFLSCELSQTIQRRHAVWQVNGELEKTWKEVVVVHSRHYPDICGSATAQAVSRRLPSVKALVRSKVIKDLLWIKWNWSGFSPRTSVSLANSRSMRRHTVSILIASLNNQLRQLNQIFACILHIN
jgi:hypothetical protein